MAQFSFYKGSPNKKSGRRYIPDVVTFPKSLRDEFKDHVKLFTNKEGTSVLYISKLLKNALDKIGRGRTSRDTIEKDISGLIKKLGEKIPTQVRSCLKNVDRKPDTQIDPSKELYRVLTPISQILGDGDIEFKNTNLKDKDDAPTSDKKDSSLDMDDLLSEKMPSLSELANQVISESTTIPGGWSEQELDDSDEREGIVFSASAPMEGWDEEHHDVVSIKKVDDKFQVEVYIAFGTIGEDPKPFDSFEQAKAEAIKIMNELKNDWDDDNEGEDNLSELANQVIEEKNEENKKFRYFDSDVMHTVANLSPEDFTKVIQKVDEEDIWAECPGDPINDKSVRTYYLDAIEDSERGNFIKQYGKALEDLNLHSY